MRSALDIQRERAALLARELVSHAPAGSIASIFAGGSLGRGEVWAAAIDGKLEVYSDIDLYVVAARDATLPALRESAGVVAMLAPSPEASFLRSPDIGVYTRADLAGQPLRPGTVELDTQHLMLYGDESIPRGLQGRSAARIPAQEGLYLIENRLWEFAGGHGHAAGRLGRAQALKAQLDVYSAHAIVEGSFQAALARRAERFRDRPPATMDARVRELVSRAFDAVRDFGAWMQGPGTDTERDRARDALCEAWRVLAPRVLNMTGSPASLVARRSRAGAWVANARDVMRLQRRLGGPFAGIALALPLLARRSPMDALRLHALVETLASDGTGEPRIDSHFDYVARLTARFPFQGSLEERVRDMHAAVS